MTMGTTGPLLFARPFYGEKIGALHLQERLYQKALRVSEIRRAL